MVTLIRPIAIYLPQFHPIPENDLWWGKGFTEWTNVVGGKPRFKGHYQPHLPSDLGFYDLRLEESRMAQEALASEYGIFGFCYYHYWFNGKRMLDEPLERKLKNPKETLPFMLCWANENWTRVWDGGENEVLLKQEYAEADDRSHVRELIRYFKDERYIKVDGKPFFAFYKPKLFPDMKRTLEIFREEAKKENYELYLTWFERSGEEDNNYYSTIGFDAAVEFQPLSKSLDAYRKRFHPKKNPTSLPERIKRLLLRKFGSTSAMLNDQIINYEDFLNFDISFPKRKYKLYPGVNPMWDNSARREDQRATIFTGSTPDLFANWYKRKKEQFVPFSENENFIFINAWNEWAEGNHLEPCLKWGRKYLEAIK